MAIKRSSFLVNDEAENILKSFKEEGMKRDAIIDAAIRFADKHKADFLKFVFRFKENEDENELPKRG